MTVADYAGIGALITSTGAAITGIVVAIRQNPIARNVAEVHDAVQTSNGETIAAKIEANDLRDLPPADGH